MTPIDYKSILQQAFAEFGEMIGQRQELDFEIAKKKQFIRATVNMLADEDKATYYEAIERLSGTALGLTDAIRKVLQREPKKSFTATDVRDKLKKANFDFSSYKTNPLASIHAVLKRLKAEEVEETDNDGVAAWRWVGEPATDISARVNDWVKSFTDSGRVTTWDMVLRDTDEISSSNLTHVMSLKGAGKKKIEG